MPQILLGGAAHNIRLVTNAKELQYYMRQVHYNMAVRVYPTAEPESRAENGSRGPLSTPAPIIVVTKFPQDLSYALQNVFLGDKSLRESHVFGYALSYLPPGDIEKIKHDDGFRQVRIDIGKLRGDALGIVQSCMERSIASPEFEKLCNNG